MSEKSKGSNNDTYAIAGVIPTRIPQNPLLSASITGLSLDDFPNKPLILPPAPPIEHLPPKPTASPLGAIGSETIAKKLVTLGKSSNIDSESLDEVNLNTSTTTTLDTQLPQIDANSNPLSGDAHPDSILSQAASSFSALPSVASTVFSTFSKRLYAGSNSREPTPDIQNSNNQENVHNLNITQNFQPNPDISIPQPTFYNPTNNNLIETNLSAGSNLNASFEPPKLYSPAQVLPQPSVQSTPPLAAAGQNTYRLTAKKKHYAPIPGLSGETQSTPLAPPNQFSSPAFVDAYQPPPQPQPTLDPAEQNKGLFSLSNLAPSGILQNISGLVQSAASTIQQGNKPQEETQSQHLNYFQPGVVAQPTTVESTYFAPPPVQAENNNFPGVFAPESVPNSAALFFNNNPSTISTTTAVENSPLQVAPPVNSEAQATPFYIPASTAGPVEAAPPAAPIKPPTVTGGPSTFRLQKGTKLYKNPLTAAELAVTPNAPAFSPFAASTATNFFVPNSAPTVFPTDTPSSSVNFFTPQQPPQVSQVPQPQQLYQTSTNSYNQEVQPTQPTLFYTPPQPQQSAFEQQPPQQLPIEEAQIIEAVEETPLDQTNEIDPLEETIKKLVLDSPTNKPTESESLFAASQDNKSELPVHTFLENPTFTSTVTQNNNFELPVQTFVANPTFTATETEKINKELPKTNPTFTPTTTQDINSELPVQTFVANTLFTPENPTAPPFEYSASEVKAPQPILPPPAKPVIKTEANPFRRNSGVAATLPTKTATPTLASFFTPVDTENKTGGDFNIFSAENSSKRQDNNFNSFFDQPTTAADIALAPPVGFTANTTITTPTTVLQESSPIKNVPPPLGFDNIVSEVKDNNNINFFNQPQQQQPLNTKQFFDNIVQPAIVPTGQEQQENQRLQNFFNNPPLSESCDVSNDLSYALIHSGVPLRNIESSSSYSNIVEPPSSACSELTTEIKQNLDLNLKQSFETNINKTADNSLDITDTSQSSWELSQEVLEELKMANLLTGEKGAATDPPAANIVYKPAVKHWFYKQPNGANKCVWVPFSHYDSALLETSLNEEEKVIAVEGGRYDVDIRTRTKVPVYWEGESAEVRRCSWFYKSADSKYVPYEEETADLLEAEYQQAALSGEWHKKVTLANGEQIVFHSASVIVHFQQQQNTDAWGGSTQSSPRPRVVKRDLDDFTIEQGESEKVNHLLFMVHGIGKACDLRMRTIEEVVAEFRRIAAQLVQSHYKHAYDMCQVGRVEVLPVSWHEHLHSTEIDEKLKAITLESIPKLRNFTNDTLLDVLFYTSPTYCQKIMNAVVTSMNTVYAKYCERNPDFNGGVSLAGHSLGSLILFDLLCHQECAKETEDQDLKQENGLNSAFSNQESSTSTITQEIKSKQISYTVGPAGTGQPYISYPQLVFHPKKFFALGSPIGMFVTIRGIDKLGLDFRLPTCTGFYNIFHPFDPVAYRIEALVNPEMSGVRPVLIPHHKGRKRMHLELKETMTRVSVDLKQRLMDTFKNTLGSVNFLGNSTKQNEREEEEAMATEVNKVIEMQKHLEEQQIQMSQDSQLSLRSRADSTSSNAQSDHDGIELDMPLGKLNDSKRIDYVLQEAPLEFFNEYLFALGSHVCYWNSADTILFVMKEIYAGLGVTPDSQVPQHSMTIERPSSRSSFSLPGQSP